MAFIGVGKGKFGGMTTRGRGYNERKCGRDGGRKRCRDNWRPWRRPYGKAKLIPAISTRSDRFFHFSVYNQDSATILRKTLESRRRPWQAPHRLRKVLP